MHKTWMSVFAALFFVVSAMAQSPEAAVAAGIQKVLPGYQFNKRLSTPSARDHVLLFSKGRETA
ncbi:MAG: hypothetical protein ACQKBV_06265, partial [Puniceicoccales bacterium]